ncbi:flavin reductase [Azospirillum oryzae]|uniref:Flavin reductase n=1 Tax=Azospirillum oryzae TaxID=286727 RepID=A0A1X7HPG4_9PROT|nr:flavin reductase [Azospirillum oryzae]SMF89847.1 flavin reductase [Azospirillum oryzae]
MVEVSRFRNGMSMLTGAVNIVTTAGPGGRAGFTATAVCSVTDQPPTLLVCLNQSSFVHRAFTTNGVLCVNPLCGGQQSLSEVFSNRGLSADERFAHADWTSLETGSPALAGALVNFDCRIVDTHTVGTHSVLYCQVVDIRQRPAGPEGATDDHLGLVYFNRSYHRLGDASRALP